MLNAARHPPPSYQLRTSHALLPCLSSRAPWSLAAPTGSRPRRLASFSSVRLQDARDSGPRQLSPNGRNRRQTNGSSAALLHQSTNEQAHRADPRCGKTCYAHLRSGPSISHPLQAGPSKTQRCLLSPSRSLAQKVPMRPFPRARLPPSTCTAGSPDDDDAPLWLARWPQVTTFDVSDSRAALANLCMRFIAHRANLEMPGLSIQMVEWALLASSNTHVADTIRCKAVALGFSP